MYNVVAVTLSLQIVEVKEVQWNLLTCRDATMLTEQSGGLSMLELHTFMYETWKHQFPAFSDYLPGIAISTLQGSQFLNWSWTLSIFLWSTLMLLCISCCVIPYVNVQMNTLLKRSL